MKLAENGQQFPQVYFVNMKYFLLFIRKQVCSGEQVKNVSLPSLTLFQKPAELLSKITDHTGGECLTGIERC